MKNKSSHASKTSWSKFYCCVREILESYPTSELKFAPQLKLQPQVRAVSQLEFQTLSNFIKSITHLTHLLNLDEDLFGIYSFYLILQPYNVSSQL